MAEAHKTPVTMLSGFLGAGKTTLLRYLLENSTEKIACIVNDVASINIDAKLVRNDRNRSRGEQVNTTADLTDTIELANGCACCNMQDELFASFEQVLALADKRGEPYTRIVLENSGVAEPKNIRDKFGEALSEGHPLMSRIELDSMVTLVDAGTFIQDFSSRTPLAARPELGDGGSLRPVVDLLVEQIECADFIIVNKVDMLKTQDSLAQLIAILGSLNPLATVLSAERGVVPLDRVFGKDVKNIVARLNVEGQHRGAVAAARALHEEQQQEEEGEGKEQEGQHDGKDGHAHGHHHAHSHGHSHDHEHEHAHQEHGSGEDCPVCDAEHTGQHAHDDDAQKQHEQEHDGHKHAHGHAHHAHRAGDHSETRAASRFGIRSFVYNRRRPFHPQRLRQMVLKWLPVSHNTALEGEAPDAGDSPIKTVLRSKGFMWMSNSHSTAYYWSHAGAHFEIRDEGDWWAALPEEEWPQDPTQRAIIEADFDAHSEHGDRRQEIVFIGVGMDEAQICQQLDRALLTDVELLKYKERWSANPDPPHAAAGRSS